MKSELGKQVEILESMILNLSEAYNLQSNHHTTTKYKRVHRMRERVGQTQPAKPCHQVEGDKNVEMFTTG